MALTISTRLFKIVLPIFAAAILLAACGDGGSDTATAAAATSPPPPPPPPGNSAPTISGNPPGQVLADAAYSFTPTASDSDVQDTLSFSVTGLPSWATFDSSTGTLSGTPGPGDVRLYSNIRITVFDGTVSASLAAFSIDVVAIATGNALLSWTPPTQNTDGSALTDLNGYKVYWGPAPGNYSNSRPVGLGQTTYLVEGLTQGTWYFVATAVNASSIESSFSNVASKIISN